MDSLNSHENRAHSICNSTRRRSNTDSKSPEFEFWMVRNPSFPQPNLLSADELFVDGFLLPLHLLANKPSDPPDPIPNPDPNPTSKEPGEDEEEEAAEREADAGPALRNVTAELTNGLTSSKRWKDIFKKGDKKRLTKNMEDKEKEKEKEKEKRREKKVQSGASSAELNINIWPFSRSRSAGNSGIRPRMVSGAPGTRKVSSAPCSRSNSTGESKSRKWPTSPGRAGIHLGRSSPIWQVKREGGGGGLANSSEPAVRSGEKVGSKKDTRSKLASSGSTNNNNNNKGKVLNLNLNVDVPMCLSYRHHLSCTSDQISAIGGAGASINKSRSGSNNGGGNGSGGNSSSGNNLFNLRSLFTKKVY